MRLVRSRVYRTLALEWDTDRPRVIVGLTGGDRPSLYWHLRQFYLRHRKRR